MDDLEFLRRMLAVAEERGVAKGWMIDDNGRVCALGAAGLAYGLSERECDSYTLVEDSGAPERFARLMGIPPYRDDFDTDHDWLKGVYCWHDADPGMLIPTLRDEIARWEEHADTDALPTITEAVPA